MTTNKNILFEDWEAEQMKDPEFRAAVEESEPAYQQMMSEARKNVLAEFLLGKRIASMRFNPHGDAFDLILDDGSELELYTFGTSLAWVMLDVDEAEEERKRNPERKRGSASDRGR